MNKLSTDPQYKLNAICPYYTMFPLEFPMRLLKGMSRDKVVLDVFCGRGTTNYAAKVNGLLSYGLDVSPVAVAIAKAKLAYTNIESVMSLLDAILAKYSPNDVPKGDFWSLCFHPETLEQICTVRAALNIMGETDVTVTLRALMLGCLHGPRTKSKTNASYFSNQMPRTFSAKPDYALSYWRRNRVSPWKLDICKIVKKKAKLALAKNHFAHGSHNNIFVADSSSVSYRKLFSEKVNMVITSPPYYGMKTYAQDQWLRNWFLNGLSEVNYADKTSLSHGSPEQFSKSLSEVWKNIYKVAADDLRMAVRFGALPSRRSDPEDIFRESLSLSSSDWQIYYRRKVGSSNNGRRQATLMGSNSVPAEETDYFIRLN